MDPTQYAFLGWLPPCPEVGERPKQFRILCPVLGLPIGITSR